MYLHLDTELLLSKETFPSEFGFLDIENNKIISTNYTLNDNEFIKENEIYLEIKNINFFIGSNNSGKSRFLRGLFKSSHTISKDDKSINYIFTKIDSRIRAYEGFQDVIFKVEEVEKRIFEFCRSINKKAKPSTLLKSKLELEKIQAEIKSILDFGDNKMKNLMLAKWLDTLDEISDYFSRVEFNEYNGIHSKTYVPS